MIPKIPQQRHHQTNISKPFSDLVAYIKECNDLQPKLTTSRFAPVLDYVVTPLDTNTNKDKCVAIRVHGVLDISTASIEMNAVASQNLRCTDPTYHFILSWPEFEKPAHEAIFDAAENSIRALGLESHQYVIAIHANTDNIHCHIAVNRIDPITFKSHNIEWAQKTLHLAARQMELKHGWSHDNGIYIIQTDVNNQKKIVINPEIVSRIPASGSSSTKIHLPVWHDPDSLAAWLKRDVGTLLKKQLATFACWGDLHTWLKHRQITLIDTGGGGMRIQATSVTTEEVIDLPASKGLRILKRSELEARWGKFVPASSIQSNVRQKNSAEGSDYEIDLHLRVNLLKTATLYDRSQNQFELKPSKQHDIELHTGASNRDSKIRNERRIQRATEREQLRRRYMHYQSQVNANSPEYHLKISDIKFQHTLALSVLKQAKKKEIAEATKTLPARSPERLRAALPIQIKFARQKDNLKSSYQSQIDMVRRFRFKPLSWRVWLHEQANLDDQAALSALRGIVYQAQRDHSRQITLNNKRQRDQISTEQRFQNLMDCLFEEERHELAIRAAQLDAMRPWQLDPLLVHYDDMHRYVTGNGNIIYSSSYGKWLFIDRGNRLTFSNDIVSDIEITMALNHARKKFDNTITLTGDDPIFVARMAKLASDMGMIILNPELQQIINRRQPQIQRQKAEPFVETNEKKYDLPKSAEFIESQEVSRPPDPMMRTTFSRDNPPQTTLEKLQAIVLTFDPYAQFELAVTEKNTVYNGRIAGRLEQDNVPAFAQHIGRHNYVLHSFSALGPYSNVPIDVRYVNGVGTILSPEPQKNKEQDRQ